MVAAPAVEEAMMVKRVFRIAALAVVWMACSWGVLAQAAAQTPSVAGRWVLAVASPHGDMEVTLVLTQDGKKVTGTLSSAHTGDRPVAGEVDDSSLKLSTTTGTTDDQFALTAKFKDADALSGYLSTSMGDMNFSGTRAKEK